MDLEALRAQARAVATRMETRINAALGANRDLTADEESANTADEAELAGLKPQIAAAEAAENDDDAGADAVAVAVSAERTRILALADLCPSSVLATPLRTAIEGGQDAGAFAIGIATASKLRGGSLADLKAGAVQEEQLPAPGKGASADKGKLKTAAEQASGILALAASAGVKAARHLLPAS
jgi:hypothetical protein